MSYNYKKHWGESSWTGSFNPAWEGIIKDNLIKGSVLDLGCGSARITPYLQHLDYLGVDISPQNIRVCKQLFPHLKFEVQDIIEWEPKQTFDNIFSWTVLEHVHPEHMDKLAAKLKRIGKNIVIVEPVDFIGDPEGYCHCHDYEKLFDAQKVYDFESVKMFRRP